MTTITKENITKFVKHFYEHVDQDPLLGPVFNDVAGVDWQVHIPKLCQFWNSVLLQTGEYKGNAFQKHVDLAKMTLIEQQHFDRWLALFARQAHKDFDEASAEFIISRAHTIAGSLKRGVLNIKHKEQS